MTGSPSSSDDGPRRESESTAVEPQRPKLPWYLNTRTLVSHLFFGPYIYVPLITALVWLAGLLALISVWARDGKPKYALKEASIVYVSNVAGKHKAIFIPITCVTAVGFVLSLVLERWLRRVDRLPTDIRKREKILNWLAILCATIGGIALILLAIFDNFNHSSVHWSMAAIFIVLTSLSAILQTGQVWSLHKDHPDRKSLLRNSIIKLIILFFGVAGAIAFAALYGVCHGSSLPRKKHSAKTCNRVTSGAAAMEWAIAFILVFFFLTLVADLWPAGKSSPRYMRQLARWQEKHEPGTAHDFTGRRAFTAHPERWENDGDAVDPVEARADEMHAAMKARNQGIDPTAPSPAHFPPPTIPLSSIAIHSNEPLNEHAAEPGQSRV
ncbi:Protein sfk1 [Vanrija pseudolonga]|uniref:Protein sfk1 n=1 Tax=Vanrija pseudolonga TaxID=143232 RepID=A0AAF0Y1J1_9TREE|nr:Protein sfk1 [Vanrija pseudolonga]